MGRSSNPKRERIIKGKISSVGKKQSIAREAEVVYLKPQGVAKWLGGTSIVAPIKTDFDYINMSSAGITKRSLDELAYYMGVSRKMMAEEILDISIKTLERKKSGEKLDKRISSHALEIAKLMQHAYEVFEDDDKVKRWLNTANRALNGMEPVRLMDTLTGLSMINDILGRIEEGVLS